MKGGTISGNIGINGGGVYIRSRASFTMKGGIISENIGVSRGGGVCAVDGNFTMDGGTISKNSTSIDYSDAVVSGEGGGVYIDDKGSFILNEGTISENTSIYGGGISDGIDYSTRITINGGTISDNTAVCGGGIHARYLTINGGKISGNRARQIQGVAYDSAGGAIDALNLCLNGGIVSNNTAEQRAGGVNVAVPTTNIFFEATFTMTGGIITGNTAGQYGGGVCNQSIFNMEGGTITGNHAGKLGGGIFDEESGSNLVITTLALSGSPVVSGNTAGESENGAGDNVVLTRQAKENSVRGEVPFALITLGELTDGAKIGVSVYDRKAPGWYPDYFDASSPHSIPRV